LISRIISAQPLDLAMSDYAEQNNLKQFIFLPNLFQHIGRFSTNKNKEFEPTFMDMSESDTFVGGRWDV
jgi:hypothetical protein